jgi:hypothetical protein
MIREAEADGYPTGIAVLVDTTRIAIDVPVVPSDVECAFFNEQAQVSAHFIDREGNRYNFFSINGRCSAFAL